MATYDGWKKFKLKAECKRRELKVSGSEEHLVKILEEDDAYPRDPNKPTRDQVDFRKPPQHPDSYLTLMEYELQDYCDERGLKITGFKWELVERLLEYDEKLWIENYKSEKEVSPAEDPDGDKRRARILRRDRFFERQAEIKHDAKKKFYEFRIATIKGVKEEEDQKRRDRARRDLTNLQKQVHAEKNSDINPRESPKPTNPQEPTDPPKPFQSIQVPVMTRECGITDHSLKPVVEGHNHIFLRVKSFGGRGKQFDDIEALWGKVWTKSPLWIRLDDSGYYIRYEDSRAGAKAMVETMEECLADGWCMFRPHEFEINYCQQWAPF